LIHPEHPPLRSRFLNIVWFFALTGLAFFAGCDNGDDPDPCKGKTLRKASFTIAERVFWYEVDTIQYTDTVLSENTVIFEADTAYSNFDFISYEWKVGTDDRTWTTKKFALFFSEAFGQIEVRLIAKWRPDLKCFPNDDGVDTVYRTFTVIDRDDNPVLGVYRGATQKKPNEIFDVTIGFDNADDSYFIRNINNGCNSFQDGVKEMDLAMGYKMFGFDWGKNSCPWSGCLSPKGFLMIDESGKNATIRFSVLADATDCNREGDKRIYDTFYGIRQ
jgi:hypothetical protein